MEDDEEWGNPPPLPSTYVTLVQLQERWLQEKQRKRIEKEEQEERERKAENNKEEDQEEEEEANLQKRRADSSTAFPCPNHHPPLRTKRWIPSEKGSAHVEAVVVYNGESKSDALVNKKKKKKKKKNKDREKRKHMRGKPRGEEDLIGGKEDLREENPVVSTENDCEKETGGKSEAVTSSGRRRGNGRFPRGVKNRRGKPSVEEDLTNGKEQLAENEVGAENIAVASTERECEKEGDTGEFAEMGRKRMEVSSGGGRGREGIFAKGLKKWANKRVEKELDIDEVEAGDFVVVSTQREGELVGNGKSLVGDGRALEKKVMGGDRSEGVLRKFERLSVRGGKAGNGKFAGDMSSNSRRYVGGFGRGVNGRRVERPSASNMVWVKKEEGGSSDANVTGV